jgi:hypothetical protein
VKPENIIGKLVEIKNNEYWTGHWGFVRAWDGQEYHVSGGSIAENNELMPVFSRNELNVPRDLSLYIQKGVRVDKEGREIR